MAREEKEIITSNGPTEATKAFSPPPPLPPKNESQEAGEKTSRGAPLAGAIVFINGALTLLCCVTGNPDGSAIRQGVLTQRMTNGILQMILPKLYSAE